MEYASERRDCKSHSRSNNHRLNQLTEAGWALQKVEFGSEEAFKRILESVASDLGMIVPGRTGQLVELLNPVDKPNAHPNSLSGRHGLTSFPLHTDTAHWFTPARFVVLGCVSTGSIAVPTMVADSRHLDFDDVELRLARSAPFKVCNGKHSFYSTILDKKFQFIRLDRDCMVPATASAAKTLASLEIKMSEIPCTEHDWSVGDILILDNWRVWHGRGNATRASLDRKLIRALVK